MNISKVRSNDSRFLDCFASELGSFRNVTVNGLQNGVELSSYWWYCNNPSTFHCAANAERLWRPPKLNRLRISPSRARIQTKRSDLLLLRGQVNLKFSSFIHFYHFPFSFLSFFFSYTLYDNRENWDFYKCLCLN